MITKIAQNCIAAGIAADNLAISYVLGSGMAAFSMSRKSRYGITVEPPNWVFILGLICSIQNMVLLLGDLFGLFTRPLLQGQHELLAVGLLFSMSIRMFQELKLKKDIAGCGLLSTRRFLILGSGTAVYAFAYGCSSNWLDMDYRSSMLTLIALNMLFLTAGVLIGKYHFERTFKYLSAIAIVPVLAGSILLIIQLINNNIR